MQREHRPSDLRASLARLTQRRDGDKACEINETQGRDESATQGRDESARARQDASAGGAATCNALELQRSRVSGAQAHKRAAPCCRDA
eukprot:6202909-Pleurochrysis_carterae.AAC.1